MADGRVISFLCGGVARVYGAQCHLKREDGDVNLGQVGDDLFSATSSSWGCQSHYSRYPVDQIDEIKNQESERREGYTAENEEVIGMGYADENVRQRPILGSVGEQIVGRLRVVLCSDVARTGTARGGEGEVPLCLLRTGNAAFKTKNEQSGEGRRLEAG